MDNNDFLTILLKPRDTFIAFQLLPYSNSLYTYKDFNYFCFPEDNYSLQIKCPIYIQRVKYASRTNVCYYIFCRYCLREWNKQSKKCPICRAVFSRVINVSYFEPWAYEKYS